MSSTAAADTLPIVGGGGAPVSNPRKPDMTTPTTLEAHSRLAEIDDAMSAIRTQIAASDLQRQMSRKPIDPRWFHRAKTALRHLQRERAELVQRSRPRRESLKDCVIAVLRERHDETGWSAIIAEAHRRADGEGL